MNNSNMKKNKNIIYNKKNNNKLNKIINIINKYIKNIIIKFKIQKYLICNRIKYINNNLITKIIKNN